MTAGGCSNACNIQMWLTGICQFNGLVCVTSTCYVWTSSYYTDKLDCLVYFFLFPSHRSPCTIQSGLVPLYDTIWSCSLVRYDLVLFPCTIRSGLVPLYDTIWSCSLVRYDLAMFSCTISISEPRILRYSVLGEL